MTDLQLIKKIKNNNCESSLLELLSRHQGICNKMIQKYCKVCSDMGVSISDLNTDKLLVTYKSALSFKANKNIKFSTWLGNQMRYHCLNSLNKINKDISMEKKQSEESNFDNLNEEKINLIFNILDQMKDDRIKKIFNLRYFADSKIKSWHEIGKKMHISTQTAINIHNKALDFIHTKMSSKISFDKI